MKPKRPIRVPRRLWLAAVLVVLGVLLAARNSTVVFPFMNSYAVVNPRTIRVKVGVAPCSWTRVTNVGETVTAILVKVETLPAPNSGRAPPSLSFACRWSRSPPTSAPASWRTRTGRPCHCDSRVSALPRRPGCLSL